jgi:hypothetical protein
MTAGILENHTRKFPASGCEDTRKSGGDIRATTRVSRVIIFPQVGQNQSPTCCSVDR